MSRYIPKIGAVFVLLLGIYFAATPGQYHSALFAAAWAIIAAIGLWFIEWKDHKGYQSLPPGVQLFLAIVLVLFWLVSTLWTSLSRRDFIQFGWMIFTLPLFWDGLRKILISIIKSRR